MTAPHLRLAPLQSLAFKLLIVALRESGIQAGRLWYNGLGYVPRLRGAWSRAKSSI